MAEKYNPVYEIDPQEYNLKLAEALKKVEEFKQPEWSYFVKTSSAKERPVEDEDFWYKRTASILREIYKNGIIGVNKLKTKYGSKKNKGYKPEHYRKGSGKIIRTILQQSDKAGFTEIAKKVKGVKSKKPGRKLTAKGKEFLESIKPDEPSEPSEEQRE